MTIATDLGIPRSTARGWLGKASKAVVSLDMLDLRASNLQQEVLELRRRVKKFTALLRLTLAVLRSSGFTLTHERLREERDKSPGKVRMGEVGPREVGHGEVGAREVCPAEVSRGNGGLVEVRTREVRPREVGPVKIRAGETSHLLQVAWERSITRPPLVAAVRPLREIHRLHR